MASERPIFAPLEEEVFVFPTSFAQQRLWFLDQLAPSTSFYNVPTVIRLTGVLNLAVLQQSFNEIVQRHEVLRTTFGMVDGQPVQLIADRLEVPLLLVDLQDLPLTQRQTAAKQQIAHEMQQPFDLAQGPLLRLLLLQLDQTEYVLVINLHHIVFDEWSIGLFIRELGLFYTALANGESPNLTELPIQYADFAQWQRDWLQGEVLASQLAYWRQQLNQSSVLELPTDRPRPPQQSHQGATQPLELPKSLADALETLSQQEGVTLFMALLAAFQAFLSRYIGQEDVAVGSPIANRNRRELEGLIGFFANSLVLRTDLSGNPTFRELLGRVRQVALAAYAHQDVPFEKLVEELQPERDLSRNPLFQVVFAVQNAPMEQLELPGLTLSSFNMEIRTTRFDLEFYLWKCSEDFRSLWGDGWQQSEGLRGVMVYSTDLFDAASIAQMLRHFQTLLTAAVIDPDLPLAKLPLLSPDEQQQLLVEWNQTQCSYPAYLCIHQVFEQQVAQTPEAIAVRFANRPYTYQELNNGSNQLAHYLRKLGVGSEVRVGICLERSTELIAGLLAILKAGGAYVPLDPTYPPERLRFMLQDAQVSIVITQQQWTNLITSPNTPSNLKVICLDQDWQMIAQESEADPINQTTPENLAYVVYTSGSTGTPKGVAVCHRAVNRLVCNTNYIQFEPEDNVAQCANIAFDAATFEIWGALLNGARLIGIDQKVMLSPQRLAAELQHQTISILFLTTALFNQMARYEPAALRFLRCLLFGGEAADVRSVREIMDHGAPEHLLHVYGPTENTTFTTCYEVKDLPAAATTIPIGKPIANTQVYVLDAHLNPVPIGVTGELYIGGDGLAQGYLNRPELTTERFIPTPFTHLLPYTLHPTPHPSLYKSGDLVRYLPDGNLEFIGRRDEQVKLRGFRIELGEIAAVLHQHETVQDAVVMVQEIADDRRLVAYVVPTANQPLIDSELRSFLKAKLPDYMVPSSFIALETLPFTPNGKVDRARMTASDIIAKPAQHQPLSYTNEADTPQTAIEVDLAAIWSEVLGLEQVSIHDNFFELGGHSLLATQCVSRIRQRFQMEIPLRCLFETPTIAEFAHHLMQPTNTRTIDSHNREEVEF